MLLLFLCPARTIAQDYFRVIGRVISNTDSSRVETLWTDTLYNITGQQFIHSSSAKVVVLKAPADFNVGDTITVRDTYINKEGAAYGMLLQRNGNAYITSNPGCTFKVFPSSVDGKWLAHASAFLRNYDYEMLKRNRERIRFRRRDTVEDIDLLAFRQETDSISDKEAYRFLGNRYMPRKIWPKYGADAEMVFDALEHKLLAPAEVVSFDEDWRFIPKDVTLSETVPPRHYEIIEFGSHGNITTKHFVNEDTVEYRIVNLPHDWSIEGEFSRENPTGQGGWLPAGIGWYAKEFWYDRGDFRHRVFLEFDGVMSHSTVFVNGREVGTRANGYASFCYDISDFIGEGWNRVAVRVDNSVQPASRWYTGSGINRHVRMAFKPDVFIPYNGIFCYSDDEYVKLEVTVCNASSIRQEITVRTSVACSEKVSLDAGESRTVRFRTEGRNLGLWDIDGRTADMSKVSVDLVGKKYVIESESVNVGFRTIRFDNETGFWLNGRNVKMKGVCLHSDAGALGTVSAENVWRSRLLTLKGLGVNAIRWAHNAPDPVLLNLCDSLGFLVMVESFDTWEAAKPHAEKGYNLDFNDNWRQDTEDLVKMARNHPCVVIYSVGNEIRDNLNSEDGFRKYRQQQELIHELDPTRPVTMALFRPNSSGVYRNGFAEMMDVVGQNYRIEELKAYHEAHPEKVIIGTENTPDIESWLMLRDDPSLCGQFLWTGIEYLGEAEWPSVSWTTSLVDITGMVKPLGKQRKSWWTTEPMVALARRERGELVSDWTPTDTSIIQDIEVYSNCSEVELILNGRSLGRQTMPSDARPARYRVKFEPGELLIAGYDDKGGRVASERICTAGQPYALKVASDSYNDAVFRAYVVDKDGNVCPNDIVPVTFQTTGTARILATDNADPMDHINHQQPVRDTWRGSCVAYVDGFDGNSTITVSAPGLKSGSTSTIDK